MEQQLVLTTYEGKRCQFCLTDNILSMFDLKDETRQYLNQIFVGNVMDVSMNLRACFVEFQKGVRGFLPLSENECKSIKPGNQLAVQVTKEAMKTKDAVLSKKLSLSGVYVVILLDYFGIKFSKKIPRSEKECIKEKISLKEGVSCIIRSNVLALKEEDYAHLIQEIEELSASLLEIVKKSSQRTLYSKLYDGGDFATEALSKVNFSNTSKITTDQKTDYEMLLKKLPERENCKVSFYEDDFSLIALHGIKGKVSELLKRNIWLKSGGYLVLEPTEALTVIDVNTGKNISKISKKELIYQTNVEAAKRIPYVLSARNISGIVIIDFINQDDPALDEKLMQILKENMRYDFVKCDVIDMTKLGLMEITREKKGVPLHEIIKA